MIKNAREYQITKSQLAKLEGALSELSGRDATSALHPLLRQAERDGLASQVADLRAEIADYDALISGRYQRLSVDSIEDLPRALIQARIAAGLTQRQLAERVQIQEQQIQRYEATEYESASITRLGQIAKALDVQVRPDLLLPSKDITPSKLFSRLKAFGLDRDFLLWRVFPGSVADSIENGETNSSLAWRAAAAVERVFGWSPEEIFGTGVLAMPTSGVLYKVPSKAKETKLSAYTVYAHHLALLALQATPHVTPKAIPRDAAALRRDIIATFGELTLETALRYAWRLGIVVLPLDDPGAFHGAFWRVRGRNVVVLKQRTKSSSRWLIDLLHEICHAAQSPDTLQLEVVETSTALEIGEDEDDSEAEATRFAGAVVLDGREEELVRKVVKHAGRREPRLKQAVIAVAHEERVPVDALANYLAFRLKFERPPLNWWATATTLQTEGERPWYVARTIFFEHAAMHHLNPRDREILSRALTEREVE